MKIKTEDETGKTKTEISRDGTTRVTTDKRGEGKTVTMSATPAWATAHNYKNDKIVYFPDYYMFYHPGRGYVYWIDGAWKATEAVPVGYTQVDWTGARVYMLEDVDLHTNAETEWVRYREIYPSRPVTIDVMVPEMK